jgi:quercetin dioxygenase-like cupin family protein
MKISDIAFETTIWSEIESTRHTGLSGEAFWRTRHIGPESNRIRVRMVEYTPGYLADHRCQKGHVLLVLEGELETVLADGRVFTLKPGMSYQVADGAEPHMSRTTSGARLFIVD